MLVNQKIPNLLNGVSQRPQTQRLSSQAAEQINVLSHPATGARKRPPSQHIGKLTSDVAGWDDAFVHSINRDEDQRYHVIIADGDIFVYDAITLDSLPVVKPVGTDYLIDTDGKGFRAVTVGDTTIITNRGVVCEQGATKTPKQRHEALLSIRQADFSTLYAVTLNGIRIAIRTLDNNDPSSRASISTDAVAADLLSAMLNDATLAADFTFTLYGSTIHVIRTNTKDFNLTTADGLADRGLQAVKEQIQAFEDLPARAPNGFIVEVTGAIETSKDNFYVMFDDLGLPQQAGVWRECPKPGTIVDFDESTMPHRLTLRGNIATGDTTSGLLHEGLPSQIGSVSLSPSSGAIVEDSWDSLLPSGTIPLDNLQAFSSFGVLATLSIDSVRVRVFYEIDVSTLASNTGVNVGFYVNGVKQDDHQHGGTRPAGSTLDPIAGQFAPDGSVYEFSYDDASVGDVLELRLRYQSFPNNPNSTATIMVRAGGIWQYTSIIKRLTIAGQLTPGGGTIFPAGTVLTITLGSTVFTRTLTADEFFYETGTAFRTAIDAHATFVAVAGYIETPGLTNAVIDVQRTDGADFTVEITGTFDNATIFHNHSLTMTPNEHVGRVIRDLTDGSQGTITANSATTITVAAMTGGVDNFFTEGDECLVGAADPAEQTPADLFWVFEPIPWKDRAVGALDVVPFPSLLGRRVSEVFFYQNRLGFLSNENIIMSSSGDLFNLFRYTATDLRADDMIDVRSSDASVTIFDSAMIWAKSLFIKSDNAWFQVSGDPALTPTTIRLDSVGKFPSSKDPRPPIVGDRVYFTRSKSGQSQVFEGVLAQDSEGKTFIRVQEITLDLPTYIQGKPLEMVGDSAEGFIALLTDHTTQRSLFIHKFQFNDGNKLQSSWSRWDFDSNTTIVGIDMVDGVLGLVTKRSDGGFIEQINLDLTPNAAEKIAYLDRRWEPGGGDSAFATGNTTFTLPYAVATDGSQGIVQVVNRTTKTVYATTRPDSTTVRVAGVDLTAASVYIGIQYGFEDDLSTIYIRGDNDAPETAGRLQIRFIDFHYTDSTDFTISVTLPGRTAITYVFTFLSPQSGKVKIPIQGENTGAVIKITNDTPGPCAFSNLDWEGFYVVRARRL